MNKTQKLSFRILIFFVTIFVFVHPSVHAQKKYWVKFNDKNGTPYSLNTPSDFLSQKSILRRTTYSIPYDQSDLPVNPTYINNIDAVPGVTVLYASKWLNGVVITLDASATFSTAFSQIMAFGFVNDTSRVKRYHSSAADLATMSTSNPSAKSTETNTSSNVYGGSYRQINQLNLGCYHELGFRGQGMTIAVLDAGFSGFDTGPVFDSIRNDGRLLGTRNFADGGTNVYISSNHGTGVMTCLGANAPGYMMGTAPKANYWLLRTEEPGETVSEEYNWIRGAEFADSVGVDMLTTSLGYTEFDIVSQNHTYATLNGRTAPMSIASNMAARKGMFVLNAAGNEGQSSWRYISVPGDADSICTVGAVDSLGVIGGFSSVGPTADGRIKPDLSAMGVYSWISGGAKEGFGGNGTSFATPVLAGAVACFWQANKSLNNIKILDSLKKSGSRASAPNYTLGWGIPQLPCPCMLKPDFTYSAEGKRRVLLKSNSIGTLSSSTYFWDFGDGQQGQNRSNLHQYPSLGSYPVFLIVNNQSKPNCIDTSAVLMVNTGPNPNLDFDFSVYYNSENSIIYIDLTPTIYESASVEIVDLAGRILLRSDLDPEIFHLQFNAAQLSDAIYIVQVKTSKGTQSKKILKKKYE